MSRYRKIAITALAALTLPLAMTACSSGGGSSDSSTGTGTFTIWHYETSDSAMGVAWNKAIEIFKQEHPGVKVKVEKQTFEQIQKNAKIVLTGDKVPDVMEYNKGNATAGQLASQGLLTPLTDAAKKYGWDKKLSGSLQTTAKYNDQGLMGSGDWYGVPNYGEFVGMYYNKDMFAKYGVQVPTDLASFESALAKFKAAGVTPLAEAGSEYPAMQLWYDLVLSQADRGFVNDYQLFKGDVDWQADPLLQGTEKFADYVKKGYIASDSAGLTAEDMGTSFISGKYPIMVSGSWWYARLASEMKAKWGMINFPGNTLQTGSSGNLWVVPANAKNKALAEDFINITLQPEVQNILGEKGGLPVAGDASKITDPAIKSMTEDFQKILDNDGLAFYPDWPVAGFYDDLTSAMQSLINQSKTPQQVLSDLGKSYESGKKDLLGS